MAGHSQRRNQRKLGTRCAGNSRRRSVPCLGAVQGSLTCILYPSNRCNLILHLHLAIFLEPLDAVSLPKLIHEHSRCLDFLDRRRKQSQYHFIHSIYPFQSLALLDHCQRPFKILKLYPSLSPWTCHCLVPPKSPP